VKESNTREEVVRTILRSHTLVSYNLKTVGGFCKQGNHLILWGVGAPRHFFFDFFYFFLKNLKKFDLTRPNVSEYSLTSRPPVIVVFHGEYKRTVTDTLKLSHCSVTCTTSSARHRVEL
jgi:hypothetical protein